LLEESLLQSFFCVTATKL